MVKTTIRCNSNFFEQPRFDWITVYDWEDLAKRQDVYGLDKFK